ncbi:MAG: hypothetical protein Q4C42_10850 [Clostridia bacterium]|nr:hypothetical protein [Clostridia bacterium]
MSNYSGPKKGDFFYDPIFDYDNDGELDFFEEGMMFMVMDEMDRTGKSFEEARVDVEWGRSSFDVDSDTDSDLGFEDSSLW